MKVNWLDRFKTIVRVPFGTDWKRAYEQQRVGVNGLAAYPSANPTKLFRWHRESDVAYSCIRVIVESAQDPDLIVQRRADRQAEWATEYGHPLRQLMMRPNPQMTQAEFLGVWLASEQICGIFFAEIERNKQGKPVALWPLDPTRMRQLADGRWQWKDQQESIVFEARDLFVSLLPDPQTPWQPLAPLQVALGPVEADALQTAYVRSFFQNSGVPSGIIKIKGVLAGEAGKKRAAEIVVQWLERLGAYGRTPQGPQVLDDNASYEKIGSNLAEIEGSTLRAQNEARICGVFGVPPLLVSAYVGLMFVNQRASAIEGQRDFWANKMSPTFKRMRTKLQWTLLLEWEREADVREETVRVFWDMANVVALQESMAEKHMRAREDFRAGATMLDEFRADVGKPPLPNGKGRYYLRRATAIPISQAVIDAQMEAAATAAARAVSLVLTGASDTTAPAEEGEDKGRRRQGDKGKCGCAKTLTPDTRRLTPALKSVSEAQDLSAAATQAVFAAAEEEVLTAAETQLASLAASQWAALLLRLPESAQAALLVVVEEAFARGIETVRAERIAAGGEVGFEAADVSRDGLAELLDTYVSQWLNQVQAEAVRLWGQDFYQKDRDAWRVQLRKEMLTASATWGAGLGRRACALGRLAAQFAPPKSIGHKDFDEEEDQGGVYAGVCARGDGKLYRLVGWVITYRSDPAGSSGGVCPECEKWDLEQVEVKPYANKADVLLPIPGSICYRPYACNCSWEQEAICKRIL